MCVFWLVTKRESNRCCLGHELAVFISPHECEWHAIFCTHTHSHTQNLLIHHTRIHNIYGRAFLHYITYARRMHRTHAGRMARETTSRLHSISVRTLSQIVWRCRIEFLSSPATTQLRARQQASVCVPVLASVPSRLARAHVSVSMCLSIGTRWVHDCGLLLQQCGSVESPERCLASRLGYAFGNVLLLWVISVDVVSVHCEKGQFKWTHCNCFTIVSARPRPAIPVLYINICN